MNKRYSILQKEVSYSDYLQLRERQILPLLVTSYSEDDKIDENIIKEFYIENWLSYSSNRKIYEICTNKLIRKKVKPELFIPIKNNIITRILEIVLGNLDNNPGGLVLKDIGYQDMNTLNKETINVSDKIDNNRSYVITKNNNTNI